MRYTLIISLPKGDTTYRAEDLGDALWYVSYCHSNGYAFTLDGSAE